jgi:hypothetical protein
MEDLDDLSPTEPGLLTLVGRQNVTYTTRRVRQKAEAHVMRNCDKRCRQIMQQRDDGAGRQGNRTTPSVRPYVAIPERAAVTFSACAMPRARGASPRGASLPSHLPQNRLEWAERFLARSEVARMIEVTE